MKTETMMLGNIQNTKSSLNRKGGKGGIKLRYIVYGLVFCLVIFGFLKVAEFVKGKSISTIDMDSDTSQVSVGTQATSMLSESATVPVKKLLAENKEASLQKSQNIVQDSEPVSAPSQEMMRHIEPASTNEQFISRQRQFDFYKLLSKEKEVLKDKKSAIKRAKIAVILLSEASGSKSVINKLERQLKLRRYHVVRLRVSDDNGQKFSLRIGALSSRKDIEQVQELLQQANLKTYKITVLS